MGRNWPPSQSQIPRVYHIKQPVVESPRTSTACGKYQQYFFMRKSFYMFDLHPDSGQTPGRICIYCLAPTLKEEYEKKKRAARFVTENDSTISSVTTMLETVARMGEFASKQNHSKWHDDVPNWLLSCHWTVSPIQPNRSSHKEHQGRYRIPFCRTIVYKDSSYPTTLRICPDQLP